MQWLLKKANIVNNECTSAGLAGRDLGIKLSPRRRKGRGKVFLRFLFTSQFFSDLIGNKFNEFLSQVCFACDSKQWMIFPYPYPDPGAFDSFCLPC